MSNAYRSAADRSILGACPDCGETIPSDRLLIKYTTEEGWPRMFAECPSCRDVVHPA